MKDKEEKQEKNLIWFLSLRRRWKIVARLNSSSRLLRTRLTALLS